MKIKISNQLTAYRLFFFAFLLILLQVVSKDVKAIDVNTHKTEARTYQIEMIIYQINNTQTSEVFSNYPVLPKYKEARVLVEKDENSEQANYTLLNKKQFTLNREENLLSKVSNYNVLLHMAWHQQQDNEALVLIENELIQGTINIKRAYYYTADIHFIFKNKGSLFVLKTHRKLKNKELHYIDHPNFGVLLKIITL